VTRVSEVSTVDVVWLTEARKRDFVDEDAQQLDNAELEFLVEELQKNN